MAISKQKTMSGFHLWGGMLFSGGMFTEVSVGRADHRSDFLNASFQRQ